MLLGGCTKLPRGKFPNGYAVWRRPIDPASGPIALLRRAHEVPEGAVPNTASRTMEAPLSVIAIGVGLVVYVREYLRHRRGKWERVRSHYRSWPQS